MDERTTEKRSADDRATSGRPRTERADRRQNAAVTPTTMLLSRDGDGWRATQRGVDVVGSDETAARAVAAYCRLVEERTAGSEDAVSGATADALR